MPASKKRFSKDPKVFLESLEEFLEGSNYLQNVKKYLWKDNKKPEPFKMYYKFTPNYLISLIYSAKSINYGMDYCEKLEFIIVAIRDGKTEYELFDKYLLELQEEQKKHKYSKTIKNALADIPNALKLLPKYKEKINPTPKKFNDYLIDTGYKTSIDELKDKYIVFDVETNGLRKANDDLLSLSIYDPTTGVCYNRYFPLELQPLILTSYIHGITDKTLADATHMTQSELNELIDYFHLKDRTILSFSGGQGTFDYNFLINYCKRQFICGLEDLNYDNIKSKIPVGGFGTEGQMSKDNLCRLLKIEGVQDIHTSYNDCILEWKLFERLAAEPLFITGKDMFKFHDDYIIPVTYISKNPELTKFAKITIPELESKVELIYKCSIPKKMLKTLKKFPTNITGVALEHGIYYKLQAKEQDNIKFLFENKSHLEYIGSLESKITEIPVSLKKDGTVQSLDPRYEKYVKEVNDVTQAMTIQLEPVFEYVKNNIFKNEEVLSQELVFSNDKKIFAICDLSSKTKVLEIKTFNIIHDDNISKDLARQLYYESNGRDKYALSIDFQKHLNKNYETVIDSIDISLFKIELKLS